eukprot:2911262-Ditylum_brightwellii.AAC.1
MGVAGQTPLGKGRLLPETIPPPQPALCMLLLQDCLPHPTPGPPRGLPCPPHFPPLCSHGWLRRVECSVVVWLPSAGRRFVCLPAQSPVAGLAVLPGCGTDGCMHKMCSVGLVSCMSRR